MQKKRLILSLVIVLTSIFIVLEAFQLLYLAEWIRVPIVPLLTYYYYLKTKDKVSYFFKFLVAFSLAESLGVISFLYDYLEYDILDYFQYYLGNIFYIIAYLFLILEISKNINMKRVIKKLPFHLLVLLILDVYCVYLVSKITINSEFFYSVYEQPYMIIEESIEIVYNSVIMLLLSVALINYLRNDSNKSMSILIASLCVVFSEVIQAAYFYIDTNIKILNTAYSILLIIAFTLYMMQVSMSYSHESEMRTIEEV